MKPCFVFLTLICLLINTISNGQNKYWVELKDKADKTFDPYKYFDSKAIERRMKQGISLFDPSDLPVDERYIEILAKHSDSILFVSRWFNAVSLWISNPRQLEEIQKMAFVRSITALVNRTCILAGKDGFDEKEVFSLKPKDEKLLVRQSAIMGADYFRKAGYNGKNIRIAIFDGGFPGVNTHPAFEHIRKENRIIACKDFMKNKAEVYYGNAHGTMVMGCIGGIYEGKTIGMATGAEFLLAKTEISSEPFSEEEAWLAAAEWADKMGADIINSSLGYTYHRYFPYNMDGKSSLVAKAANMAASKGILVVNAAGNEGNSPWKTIGTPADADSVLSVGGIDPGTLLRIDFSSYGPNTRGTLKPNVSAFGKVITCKKNGMTEVSGTSFASPLTAGFAACAWQSKRELSNMELFSEIEKSAHLYPYYDYSHGYGIPQASYFTENNKEPKASFEFQLKNNKLGIIAFERPETIDETASPLFIHIADKSGFIKEYFVISVYQKEMFSLDISAYSAGDIVSVHYKKFTKTYAL